jgi:uncharacterized protein (DUF2384 family)
VSAVGHIHHVSLVRDSADHGSTVMFETVTLRRRTRSLRRLSRERRWLRSRTLRISRGLSAWTTIANRETRELRNLLLRPAPPTATTGASGPTVERGGSKLALSP